ncbi:hypothetical protein L486_00874 [Kwoniella mangroviensis CBS 10435]|uniref:Uncharacterized protein n=1 Tax=Kwoniella mangroviensis CBS 10435 TaxID=1331196 RepID=A0A1B9J0C0_9TREE|nr:hypothetical protein L486_00874 [Kwoniella mangroviensis CBS 10435]
MLVVRRDFSIKLDSTSSDGQLPEVISLDPSNFIGPEARDSFLCSTDAHGRSRTCSGWKLTCRNKIGDHLHFEVLTGGSSGVLSIARCYRTPNVMGPSRADYWNGQSIYTEITLPSGIISDHDRGRPTSTVTEDVKSKLSTDLSELFGSDYDDSTVQAIPFKGKYLSQLHPCSIRFVGHSITTSPDRPGAYWLTVWEKVQNLDEVLF